MFFLLWLLLTFQETEVWLCPVHRDVQSVESGQCNICERELEKRRFVPVWACPMHSHATGGEGDVCSICKMALARTTQEIQWVCTRHPDMSEPHPGNCPVGGRPLERRSVAMPHGDHNPRHGGMLFMAPNGFNHLEGALSPDGIFSFYLYDDFTRPIDAGRVEARIGDRSLTPAGDGDHSELTIDGGIAYPVELTLFVRFEGSDDEVRFDFIFVGPRAPIAEVSPLLIPEGPQKIAQAIFLRDTRIQDLMRVGGWTDLYIPAMEAKELALALGTREGETVALPVKKLVRAAWLLDMYGDLGNRLKVESAYELFEEGIRDLEEIRTR